MYRTKPQGICFNLFCLVTPTPNRDSLTAMGSLSELSFVETLARYEQERQKRLRPEGLHQYADIGKTEKYKRFGEDPWKTADSPYISRPSPMSDGDHAPILIVGTGFSALLFAVRFLEAGFKVEDLIFVDSSWGFGGTW